MIDATTDTRPGTARPADDGDELARMVAAIERMSEGISGILALAVKFTPNTPPGAAMVRLRFTPHDVERLRSIYTSAATNSLRTATVPITWLAALLAVLDDPRWVP